jgi:hypothetical protein
VPRSRPGTRCCDSGPGCPRPPVTGMQRGIGVVWFDSASRTASGPSGTVLAPGMISGSRSEATPPPAGLAAVWAVVSPGSGYRFRRLRSRGRPGRAGRQRRLGTGRAEPGAPIAMRHSGSSLRPTSWMTMRTRQLMCINRTLISRCMVNRWMRANSRRIWLVMASSRPSQPGQQRCAEPHSADR